MRRLFWFAFAGGAGFVVDAGILQLLLSFTPLGPFVARIVSIATAMSFTWFINRTFTFGRSKRHPAAEGARYGFIGGLSALVNYGLYSLCLLCVPSIWPVIAVGISSLGAMVFSYLGYSRFVFSR
ncbi:GtrA family protein [Rhizobium sp. L1K21]|uniref:GtrA family protein n=1 Tax=Rhizobium sp. L1K21 TaxID=2954933 RepID=UPI002092B645|nr:GtrA family protein [Rhizobium sp. L1K21]MCO6185535.1 GtrA family protein [Rhizobium sp. L1K21]